MHSNRVPSPTRKFLLQRIKEVGQQLARGDDELIELIVEYDELRAVLQTLPADTEKTGRVWTMWNQYCHENKLDPQRGVYTHIMEMKGRQG